MLSFQGRVQIEQTKVVVKQQLGEQWERLCNIGGHEKGFIEGQHCYRTRQHEHKDDLAKSGRVDFEKVGMK